VNLPYVSGKGGQNTQLHYLSKSIDTTVLLHYKWKLYFLLKSTSF